MPTRYWTREEIIQAMLDWEAIMGSPPTHADWTLGWQGEYPSIGTVIRHFGSWQAAKDAAWSKSKLTRTPPHLWPRERIISEFQRWARDHNGMAPAYDDLTPRNGLPTPGRVQDEFGSVASAVHEAGLVPLPSAVSKRAVRKYLPLPKRSD